MVLTHTTLYPFQHYQKFYSCLHPSTVLDPCSLTSMLKWEMVYPTFTVLIILFHLLLSTRFPAAGLSTSHVRANWLHDWNSAAKWAQLLIAYPVAALSNMQKVLNTMRAELA